jgi:hypothetical protein
MFSDKKSIVILGGGTAGWIAANLIATNWEDKGMDITLVESPDIGIIGVGEGSTPPLKNFFEAIGVQESDWMERCDATYKVGITFRNWSTKPGFEEYFHPFMCQPDQFSVPAFFHNSFLRRKGIDLDGHPNKFFITWELAKQRLAPVAPPNFPFEMNYGYHFNSGLLGQFLQEWAAKRGVKYKQATVTEVRLDDKGFIDYLETQEGEDIKADFYVDSTGFRSQLLQQALKVPFESCEDVLFNDSAVVFPTEPDENPTPQTISTALKYGWGWKIPLTSRFGNGYVYSSKYVDDDEAEREFRDHLGLLDSDVEARRLKFKVGRVREHWVKNCLAVGLSQGWLSVYRRASSSRSRQRHSTWCRKLWCASSRQRTKAICRTSSAMNSTRESADVLTAFAIISSVITGSIPGPIRTTGAMPAPTRRSHRRCASC